MRKFTNLLVLFVLCLVGMQGNAQNVTIKATNGSMIAAVKNGGTTDTFFGLGGFATWQHEQLCMVLTVADGTDLTPNGQLDNPANNLFSDGTHIQIAKGKANGANTCYVSLSLPSGYRFTGYKISFSKPRNAQNSEFNTGNNGTQQSTFGETNSSFTYVNIPGDTTQANITIGGEQQKIHREADDMSNVLYFRLQDPTSNRALITLESAEFYFTAEENYSPLTPAGIISSPVSAVDVPFSTSKVDYGTISRRTYNGSSRVSYSSANVTDLEANFTLYEAEAIKDGTGVDGLSGKVVDYNNDLKTISSVGGYFKLACPENKAEQVYYIETPTYVELSNGTKNPVGYRIVAAEFDYATSVTAAKTFYITYTYNNTKYYLNTQGRFTTTPVIWEIDDDGYISSNGLYLYWSNGYCATQSTKPDSGERFTIAVNGRIYQTSYTSYYIRFYPSNGTYYGLITNNNYGEYAIAEELPSPGDVGNFTLKIYDKEGLNPQTISVTGTGSTSITGLNNDAVKFGIIGTGLLRATLTVQALDPYLDQMEVVCQDDAATQIRMTENFTASDFSVSGGEFYFYLPEELIDTDVKITFEDLKSKYFDETYTGGHSENKSRINFVKSAHYNAFGATNNNIYTNVSEAKNAQLERLKVGIVGTKPFKFNNADEVGTSGGTYTEYPFSLEKYAASPNSGAFSDMKFTVSAEDQKLTRYVFTTDETRYNIAPTTANQHRAYAFYTMIVHVQSSTYNPVPTFTKIYEYTNYDNSAAGGSVDENKVFWGTKITALDDNGKPGYASTTSIFKAINDAIDQAKEEGHPETVPNSQKEILYLDFSQLAGIYQVTDNQNQSMQDFADNNAANCLIFLPKGHSAPNNNVAYMMEDGTSFKAANNIVLTDKQPFYSPYDIQVDVAKYAMYTRKLTYSTYDKDELAMVMLPFALTLGSNGYHSNPSIVVNNVELPAGQNSFEVKMMNSASLAETSTAGHDYGVAYFAPVTGEKTAANRPYMVKVDKGTVQGDPSFVAIEKGAYIQATTGMSLRNVTGEDNQNHVYNYIFTGEQVSGSMDDPSMSVTLMSEASYSGQKYDRAHSEKIFYFANNKFLNLYKLNPTLQYLYAYPFHPVYSYTENAGANIDGLNITFEPFVVDYIHEVTKSFNPDLAVRSGKGFIQMTSDKNQTVDIRSFNGTSFSTVNMNAGDSKTVNLPAGVYLVNNVKIIVK